MKKKDKNIVLQKYDDFHSKSLDEIFSFTNSNVQGLSTANAELRLENDGKNELPTKSKKNIFKIILKELINPIVLLLLVATLFSLLVNEFIDALAIAIIVVINITIGTWQEKKAERIAKSLLNLVKTEVKVLRDGEKILIDAKKIVIGDIVFLESGDKAPADLRIINCSNLKVDESILTGESIQVEKNFEILPKDTRINERKNMIFAGSSVLTGRAITIVVAVAVNTVLGEIANTLDNVKNEKTPLEQRIDSFSKYVTIAISIIAIALFTILFIQNNDFNSIFLVVVALTVSAIPEGLPLAVTMALSIASNKMGKKNVIVKKLNAVESLGSCTIIASDKTGTLTLNQQTAKIIALADGNKFEISGSGYNDIGQIENIENNNFIQEMALNGVINNEAKLYKRNKIFRSFGDSIDIAFLALGLKAKVNTANITVLFRIPYESEKKYSAVIYKNENQTICTAKGSIEKILSLCSTMKINGNLEKINFAKINAIHEKYAKQGYRLIAMANGIYKNSEFNEENLTNLTFLGFVGFIDPIRLETKPAIQNCINAGIKVLMITGDHPLTAFAIAKEINILQTKSQITTGDEVRKYYELGKKEFNKFIKTKTVFSRVTPMDKLNIVNALKENGEFVAVTGDGVNDAPAIKSAHIGIAMGSGTDVAKETSDMIIADDNFSSIVHGIKEGRTAYSNIRKVTYLLISEGIAEILFFALSIFLGLPIPLVAIQLLYLNVITNGLQDIALSFERSEEGIMKESPRSPKESLFSKSLIRECIIAGITIGLMVFAIWVHLINDLNADLIYARSLVMALMVFLQNFHAFNCRSEVNSIFSKRVPFNYFIVVTILLAIALQITIMEVPMLSSLLSLTSVPIVDLLTMLALSVVITFVMEIYKLIVGHYRKKHNINTAY